MEAPTQLKVTDGANHGEGFPDIRATQAESDWRAGHRRRRSGCACQGLMLTTARLAASNSSAAEAGTLLWVPAVQLRYPEARGGGASCIRRTGRTSFCFLLQTSCWSWRAKSSESVKSMRRTAAQRRGNSRWNQSAEAENLFKRPRRQAKTDRGDQSLARRANVPGG